MTALISYTALAHMAAWARFVEGVPASPIQLKPVRTNG